MSPKPITQQMEALAAISESTKQGAGNYPGTWWQVNSLTVSIPIKRRSGRRLVTLHNGETAKTRPWDTTATPLQLALAWGHRQLAMLESGEAESLREIAALEGVDSSYVSRMVNLTWPHMCQITLSCSILRLIHPCRGKNRGRESIAIILSVTWIAVETVQYIAFTVNPRWRLWTEADHYEDTYNRLLCAEFLSWERSTAAWSR